MSEPGPDPGPAAAEPDVWGRCPANVLMSVLRQSDMNSIVQCYSVNRWWRNTVDNWAQLNNKWHILASEMMPNKGDTFIRKSLLGWKDLYNNYKLWHQVEKARLMYDCELTFSTGIHYLHVFKDLLTVVHKGEGVKAEMTMFRINESGFQPATKTKGPYTSRNGWVISVPGMNLVQAIINSGPYKRIAFPMIPAELTKSQDYFYGLNANNEIEFLFWGRAPILGDDLVCRYNGSDLSLDDFQLMEASTNLIILFMKHATLTIVNCDKKAVSVGDKPYNRPHLLMHSEKIFRPTHPSHFFFHPKNDFDFTRERKQEDRNDHTANDESTESAKLKDDCRIVYNSGKRFVGLTFDPSKTDQPDHKDDGESSGLKLSPFIACCVRWVGCDRNLTSATQHGDMLLLGYQDGKIEIHKINFEVVADTSPAKFVFNIKNYVAKEKDPTKCKGDYRVIVIEVYEMNMSHCLLIATRNKLYRFVLSYPNNSCYCKLSN